MRLELVSVNLFIVLIKGRQVLHHGILLVHCVLEHSTRVRGGETKSVDKAGIIVITYLCGGVDRRSSGYLC